MNWREFEDLARVTMSRPLDVEMEERIPAGSPKRFDMVDLTGQIVGDAKYLTLVHGKKLPPAKFMEIAGHVWLLEQIPMARRRFLVFGNQKRVPEWWLEKYGMLVKKVEFYFLKDDGTLEQLR